MQKMNQIKILLVEDDENVQEDFRKEIEHHDDFQLVNVLNREKEALAFIKMAIPHVIVTELSLQQGDGIDLILETRKLESSLPLRPYIIVITSNTSLAILNMLNDNLADFIYAKKMDDFGAALVLRHLSEVKNYFDCKKTSPRKNREILHPVSEAEHKTKLKIRIETLINQLCISPNLIGRLYLVEALMLAVEHGEKPFHHTKVIYPVISKQYRNSVQNIDRAINIAIENAWNKTDYDTLKKCYGGYIDPERSRPTCGEFLKYYANLLKMEGW